MTAPSTWLEGLVKAYVGDGLAADFYREIAEFVDPSTRALILEVLADSGQRRLRGPRGAGRDRDRAGARRTARAVGSPAGRRGDQPDPARAGRAGRARPQLLMRRHRGSDRRRRADLTGITDQHAERMAALGLSTRPRSFSRLAGEADPASVGLGDLDVGHEIGRAR